MPEKDEFMKNFAAVCRALTFILFILGMVMAGLLLAALYVVNAGAYAPPVILGIAVFAIGFVCYLGLKYKKLSCLLMAIGGLVLMLVGLAHMQLIQTSFLAGGNVAEMTFYKVFYRYCLPLLTAAVAFIRELAKTRSLEIKDMRDIQKAIREDLEKDKKAVFRDRKENRDERKR